VGIARRTSWQSFGEYEAGFGLITSLGWPALERDANLLGKAQLAAGMQRLRNNAT
jgi:hypothetical protein